MGKSDPWPTIFDERRSLAADLQGLTDQQWSTLSLCSRWTVCDVLGHMTATAKLPPPAFFAALLSSGFSFTKMQARGIERETADGGAAALERFREIGTSKKAPPGPADTWLGEVIVHSEDIRRPLGIAHEYPAAALKTVADFYKGSNLLIGGKKRAAGLTWRATDTDWSTGTGPEITGPMMSLVMAIVGRSAVVNDLSGDGVATLRTRLG